MGTASHYHQWIHRTGRLAAVRAYIENNLEWGVLTPANTARALSISVRQLHLLFEPSGTTFSRYVLARRLERARSHLVHEADRTVLDIALSCGIESSTVFYRAFRDAFGVTPTGYRKSVRGRIEQDRLEGGVERAGAALQIPT